MEQRIEYVDTKWVARATGIPENTWRWWVHNGQGPRHYKVGRLVRYKPDEVLAWIESQAVQPAAS